MSDQKPTPVDYLSIALSICLVLGTLLSANLAFASLNNTAVLGCSLESGCNAVLASNWSAWFQIPLSVISFTFYLTATLLFVVKWLPLPEENRNLATWIIHVFFTTATFSGIWFILIQIFFLNQFCWVCMSVHVCSLLGCLICWKQATWELRPALRILLTSCFALLLIIIGQVAVSKPVEPEMVRIYKVPQWPAYELFDPLDLETPPRRVVKVADGVIEVDTYAWPIIGDPEAKEVMIELFDYRCDYCQQLSHHLDHVRQQYPDLAIIALPFPLNSYCNPHMQGDETGHEDSCLLAEVAINLWRQHPEKFADFHHWLFSGEQLRTGDEALDYLEEQIGTAALEEILADGSATAYVNLIVDLHLTNTVSTVPAIYTKYHFRQGETKSLDLILPTIIADHQLEDLAEEK